MITNSTNWESVKNIGTYTIKKQFIHPHQRYLFSVFGWGKFRKYVDSPKHDTEVIFVEKVSFWSEEECERWINFKIKAETNAVIENES